MRHRRTLFFGVVLPVVLGACSVLLYSTASIRKERLWQLEYRIGLDGQRFSMASWRFWDDVGIGISRYLDWVATPVPPEPDPGPMIDAYRELLERRTRDAGILPHEFWRTLSPRPFLRGRLGYSVPPLEDPGRPVLIAAGFVALGGISPYLLIWIGTLFFLPLLAWVAWETFEAGYAVAGLTLVLVSVTSCFVVESLSLPHSAVGFYVAAVYGLVALATYAVFGRGTSGVGYTVRLMAAALLFAVCACARSGTVAMAPAFLFVLLFALRRIATTSGSALPGRARRLMVTSAVCVAFLTPYLLVKPTQRHNFWTSYWQGLGDFGADRGHSWHDRDLKRFLAGAGVPPFEHPRDLNPQQEEFLRRVVQAAIVSDPIWFAGILVKRTFATIALTKLWPWGPRDGHSIEPPLFHYKYVVPIDWFGVGASRFELPVSTLWLPTVALFVFLLRGPQNDDSGRRSRLRCYALILGVLALATLPVPVIVTTAAGMETQTFGLVYFLGLGFLAQELVLWVRARFAGRRAG